MVSADHFRQELRAQMARATIAGQMDVLIKSGELCRSLRTFTGSLGLIACCDAMQAEFKPGDTMILDRANGAGRPLFAAAFKVNWSFR
jgi:hypothetical protein